MKDTFAELKKHIEKKGSWYVVLSGEEYAVKNAIQYIRELFKDYEYLPFFVENAEHIPMELRCQSIFGRCKLLAIFHPEKYPSGIRKEILDILVKGKVSRNIFVLIVTDKPDMFRKSGLEVLRFKQVYSREVDSWIRSYVGKRGKVIPDESIYMIRLIFGNDRQAISGLLDVLLSSTENVITPEMIRSLRRRDGAVFDMLEAVFRGNKKKAIESFIVSGAENYAYSLLQRDAYISLLVNTNRPEVIKRLNLRDFVLKKYREKTQKGFNRLKGMFIDSLHWDYSVKTGLRSFETGILFVYKTTQGGLYGNG